VEAGTLLDQVESEQARIAQVSSDLAASITANLEVLRRVRALLPTDPITSTGDHWLAFPLTGLIQSGTVRVTGEFGVMYTIGGVTWKHEGVDLSVPIRTPVYACAAGQVKIAEVRKGYGNCVRIQHVRNGERWWTWYGHLSQIRCQVGDIVDAGQVIGLSGNTGNTTGPHLHLTVQREDDKTLPIGCSEILRGCVNPRLFVQWPA